MSQFITDIWESVFQPGTNRSVIIATYASFAALQATLIALLIATLSWHFVFLNVICGCLWGAIVWFVSELEEVKRVEAEAERLRKLKKASEEGAEASEESAEEEEEEGSKKEQ
ncbi:ER protein Pkr1-domain-containing protein [Tricharina praecox]|uniref:ER protein Pkr1-domain-containing protein n=1 Tax=Tricharina praecox TaxID=43433 RepID=UPI00222065C4|nr:ER protein Pkr1-domain-containing protein [Tricharina praecox]KAI5842693.1 ER protein Pkr1-domain-containing protein [Tricharina praecox]